MSKPILCIGSYAENPYHIEKIGRNVYCIEELCYCIVKNAFLLDEESFGSSLFDWIEEECSLVKLADELRSMYAKKCSMAALAGTILDYVGYNTRKEVDKTEEILRGNAGMDVYQKKLARANFLLKNGRYAMAFREYEFLLANTPSIDRQLRGRIEHNEGVMYARLFLFDKAAKMFLKAYEDGGDKESYYQYLSAVRMDLSNKEYVSFIADNDEAYEASMEIEKRMKEAEDLYASSDENHKLGTLSVYKAEGKMHEYYDQVGEITDKMKQTYRELVKDRVK
jgi:tetratricopeptide (TPR) repeat protein